MGLFGPFAQIGAGIETNNVHFHHITLYQSSSNMDESFLMQFVFNPSDTIGRFFEMDKINRIFDINFFFGWLNINGFMIGSRAWQR